MKELLDLIKQFDLKALFLTPTKNGMIQFFRYIFVGGVATVVDWGTVILLTEAFGIYHLVSAVFSFLAGLITNFILSKQLVFKANTAAVTPFLEFVTYTVTGAVGLGLTELIMFCCTEWFLWHYMLSKAIATVLVLLWNYLSRKIFLYKE